MTNREFIDIVAPEHKLLTCVEGKAVNALQESLHGVVECPRCSLLAMLPDHDADLVSRMLVGSATSSILRWFGVLKMSRWRNSRS